MTRSTPVRELHDRLAPVTLARDQLLPVPEPLLPLFPFGGLPKGQSVGVEGPGGWSLALALAGSLLGDDGWMAVVGVEELGLVAAAGLGVRLDRVLVVEAVPSDQLGTVVAALVEVVGVVALAPRRLLGQRDARRLTARAREQGTTLLHLDGGRHWPQGLDLTLTTRLERWEGVGQGHGHLRSRLVTVSATGRRAAARRREAMVLLPGPDGRLGPSPDATAPASPARAEPGPASALAQVG